MSERRIWNGMAKPKKRSVRLYCELEADVANRLQAYSDATGVPKTVVVEKALGAWFRQLDTGQVPGMPVDAGASGTT